MVTLFILLAILLALDLAVWKWGWGCDSRDNVDSSEWGRLHNWLGFH